MTILNGRSDMTSVWLWWELYMDYFFLLKELYMDDKLD